MNGLLELDRASIGYGDRIVVREVTLTVDPGRIIGLLGGNGAGKSSILRAVYGQATLIEGAIRLDGHFAEAVRPPVVDGAALGILLQRESVFSSLTVKENILIAARGTPPQLRERLGAVVDLFPEVKPWLGRTAGVLSGGERRIVGVSRLVASGARLWLLDEPGAGLARPLLERLFARLSRHAKDRGIGMLLVEQHIAAALEVVDDLVVIQGGRQVFTGPPEDTSLEQVGRMLLSGRKDGDTPAE